MKNTNITNNWLRRATQIPRIIEENGFLTRLMLPIFVETISINIKPYLNGKRLFEKLFLKSEIHSTRERREEILKDASTEHITTIEDLGLDAGQRKVLEEAQQQKSGSCNRRN